MKALFVACQDPSTRSWFPVGKLTWVDDEYRFNYTKGVLKLPDFRTFGRLTDLEAEYRSKTLFPLFANRVLSKSRPEHGDYINWLALGQGDHSVLDELARTGGRRATDAIELVPLPEPTEKGDYETFFFCRGLRHLTEESRERVNLLKEGDQLYVLRDIQNAFDPSALLMRTGEPVSVVGYAPAYFSAEFEKIIERNGPGAVRVNVERVNPDAPMQYRLLCRLVTRWPEGFSPFLGDDFQDYMSDKKSS
jgi:hypothetical protein